MKVIHKNSNAPVESRDTLTQAKKLEQEGKQDKAIEAFEKIIGEDPLNEYAYNRLMILYRKNREYKKELAVIKKGIAAFERSFKSSSKITITKKISTLSRSLLKSLGLSDKKGNSLYEREPLGRWNKRRLVVERLNKKQKKNG